MTSQRSFCPSDQRPGWMILMGRDPLLRSGCMGRRTAASRQRVILDSHFSRRGAVTEMQGLPALTSQGNNPDNREPAAKRNGRSPPFNQVPRRNTEKTGVRGLRTGLGDSPPVLIDRAGASAGLDRDPPGSRGSTGFPREPRLFPQRPPPPDDLAAVAAGVLEEARLHLVVVNQGLGFEGESQFARARHAWPGRHRPRTPGGRPTAG